MKYTFILTLLISNIIFAGGPEWDEQVMNNIQKSKTVFIGKVIESKEVYFINYQDGKGKQKISKEKAISYYKSILSGEIEIKDLNKFPRVTFDITASIKVESILRGKNFKKIELKWYELHDSMCPHPKTRALDKKLYIWYGDADAKELTVVPQKYLPEVKQLVNKK